MNFSKAERIFITVFFYNWDFGTKTLLNLLENKDCDKSSALLIYWESDPGFYYGYNSVAEIPDWAINGYELMKIAEQNLLNDKYPELISYEADESRIPKDANILEKIPKKLLLPSVGKNNTETLVNHFHYGTLLLKACHKGNLDEVIKLVEQTTERGFNILNVCIDDETPIDNAIRKGKTKIIEYLLSKGANVNTTMGELEVLPIHRAALLGKQPAIKTLIKYGADINALTLHTKRTALHIIANISEDIWTWQANKLDKIIEFLLKNGADANIKDQNGNTALELAINKKNETAAKIIEKYSK